MTDNNKPTYFKQYHDDLIPMNVSDAASSYTLSKAAREFIDEWIKRYPKDQKQSGIFEALRFVQEENGGFLTPTIMDAVADYLTVPRIAAYEVAAFYSMYHLNPVGKHVIHICTNISCALNGAEKIVEHVQKRLKIGINETTEDGRFTLKEAECLGACIAAPVCIVNKTYYENVTFEKMDEVLATLRKEVPHGE